MHLVTKTNRNGNDERLFCCWSLETNSAQKKRRMLIRRINWEFEQRKRIWMCDKKINARTEEIRKWTNREKKTRRRGECVLCAPMQRGEWTAARRQKTTAADSSARTVLHCLRRVDDGATIESRFLEKWPTSVLNLWTNYAEKRKFLIFLSKMNVKQIGQRKKGDI